LFVIGLCLISLSLSLSHLFHCSYTYTYTYKYQLNQSGSINILGFVIGSAQHTHICI